MAIKNWWPFGHKNKQKKINHHVDDAYSSLVRVYTPVTELTLGMYVVELDRSWLDSPFKFQGFELKTEDDIRAVKEVCEYVYIDMTKTKTPKKAVIVKKEAQLPMLLINEPPPQKLGGFETEITQAERIYESTGVLVADFMEKIAKGGGVDTKLAKQAVSECVKSVLFSPDAMLWLSHLKNKDEYTSQHSLNVCVLSIVLGRHLSFSENNLNTIGLCGLMHDMGKMLVPLEILNKPGLLEPHELKIMQSHAELGYELLKSSEGMHKNAIEAAYSHHEQLNGKGYPRQLSKDSISLSTRIVTIADMYDAITSDRVYQKGKTHLEATGIMTTLANTHLDSILVYKFIECLGVYPPGCLVEMTNGAIAIVVEVNDNSKLRPKIIIILDEEKNPVPEQVLDLSEMVMDRKGDIYTIKGIVKAGDWNIDASKYYQEGVLQKGFARNKGN
jgi:HD-GYP domain-containing protein (c-di-GMP phosphodiesterase class II)